MYFTCNLALLCVLLVGIFISCKDKTDAATEDILNMEKEILRIHDEVMPKMSDIARLQDILHTHMQNPQLDSLVIADIQASLADLDAGDSLMWEWMHNYKKPEDAPTDSIRAYLKREHTRIQKVSDVMLKGIDEAEKLAQKLGHE